MLPMVSRSANHSTQRLLQLLVAQDAYNLTLTHPPLNLSTYSQNLLWVDKVTDVDRAIVQAVSRWLPIVAARVRSRVWSSGICGRQSVAGADFLRVLRFPLPIFIPTIAGTIGQNWL
jgi:hypothetical protein